MEIQIKHHADGTPYVRPYLGTNKVTGQVLRPYHRFPGMTDAQALKAARAWIAEIAPAADVGVSHRTGDLLARYVRWVEENGRSANTVKTYRTLSRYAEPIATVPARDVRTSDLERLYHRLLAPGEDGRPGLSNNTVIEFHWFLSGAFGWMARIGAVDANPASSAEPPEPGVYEAVAFDAEAFVALTHALDEERRLEATTPAERMRREAAFGGYLALNTGLRCGEVCALRKSDAQLHRRNLLVGGTVVEAGGTFRQATTKGRKRRNVALDQSVADAIREHEALVAGTGGRRGPKAPLLTVGRNGWIRPSALSAAFRGICADYGLPREATFHSLRHTHATWLLLQGVDMRTVSERLGHSSVAVTLSIYAHVLPGRDAQAAEAFARAAKEAAGW